MKTISILMLAFAAVGLSSAETALYAPSRSIADQGITVHSWGGATISETDETAFEGSTSIRISPKNLFSGGKIEFNAHPDLSKEYGDKNALLRITFKPADTSTTLGAGGKAGGISGANGGGKGGPPAGGPPAGGPPRGGGQKGGGGGASSGGGANFGLGGGTGQTPGGIGGVGGAGGAPKAELKTLRVVITTTDGLKSEIYVPSNVTANDQGWRQVGIPLQAITGFGRTNKVVQEIGISGDKATSIWIGDIRTIVDTTPITGDANQHEYNLGQGDEITLSASGDGGASMLKYEWYFDKDTSGLPDAVGQAIKHKFRKPDTYTITLVISDYYGLKQPYKTTITAKVN